jgi:hypothetical protein
MPRGLAWIKTQDFQGYGCSECDWKYKPTGLLSDEPLDEMKKKYEAERDKEFVGHACVNYLPPKLPKTF